MKEFTESNSTHVIVRQTTPLGIAIAQRPRMQETLAKFKHAHGHYVLPKPVGYSLAAKVQSLGAGIGEKKIKKLLKKINEMTDVAEIDRLLTELAARRARLAALEGAPPSTAPSITPSSAAAAAAAGTSYESTALAATPSMSAEERALMQMANAEVMRHGLEESYYRLLPKDVFQYMQQFGGPFGKYVIKDLHKPATYSLVLRVEREIAGEYIDQMFTDAGDFVVSDKYGRMSVYSPVAHRLELKRQLRFLDASHDIISALTTGVIPPDILIVHLLRNGDCLVVFKAPNANRAVYEVYEPVPFAASTMPTLNATCILAPGQDITDIVQANVNVHEEKLYAVVLLGYKAAFAIFDVMNHVLLGLFPMEDISAHSLYSRNRRLQLLTDETVVFVARKGGESVAIHVRPEAEVVLPIRGILNENYPYVVDRADVGYFVHNQPQTYFRHFVSQVNLDTDTVTATWTADDFLRRPEEVSFLLHPDGTLYAVRVDEISSDFNWTEKVLGLYRRDVREPIGAGIDGSLVNPELESLPRPRENIGVKLDGHELRLFLHKTEKIKDRSKILQLLEELQRRKDQLAAMVESGVPLRLLEFKAAPGAPSGKKWIDMIRKMTDLEQINRVMSALEYRLKQLSVIDAMRAVRESRGEMSSGPGYALSSSGTTYI